MKMTPEMIQSQIKLVTNIHYNSKTKYGKSYKLLNRVIYLVIKSNVKYIVFLFILLRQLLVKCFNSNYNRIILI